MYRLIREGYSNFIDYMKDDSYYLQLSQPIALLADFELFNQEKEISSLLYMQACDLLRYLDTVSTNSKYRKFQCLSWQLQNKGFTWQSFNISDEEHLHEQAEIIRQFLDFCYIS